MFGASLLAVAPSWAEETDGDDADCAVLDDPTFVVDSEESALDLAVECGVPVEVEAMREEAARFTAEVDGTVTAELYAAPQWTTDADGAWVDIDPTLAVGADDLIRAAAVPGEVIISGGGVAQPLVAMITESGETLDLWWPTELPEPVLDGAVARFHEVFTGVNLVVEAGRTGFAYRLEIKTAEAASNPALAEIAVELGGTLEISQDTDTGVVTAADSTTGEAVLTSAGAFMWDSSEPAAVEGGSLAGFFGALNMLTVEGSEASPGDPGRVERMDVALQETTLTITPGGDLLTDPATVFPVVLDPSFEPSQWAWTTVSNGQYADSTWWDDAAWPRSGGLRMGYNGWVAPGEEGYGAWRSMIRFDLSKLSHSAVTSATASVDVNHTGGCLSYPLELWQTNVISKGTVPTSWNSTAGNWLHGAPLDTQTVDSANSSAGCTESYPTQHVSFASEDLTDHVNRHANAPYLSITLGLKAAVEDHREHWFRADAATAHLTVVYEPVIAIPSALAVDDIGCLAPEGARVVGSTPVLSAVPHSSDGTAQVRFSIRDASGATVTEHTSPDLVETETAYEWEVETALPDGAYEFQAGAVTLDGASSRFTTWCSFEVDSTLDAIEDVSTTALSCPYDTTGLDPAVDTLESPTEGGALLLAEACSIGVEVTGLSDFDTQVVADPDGTLTAQVETVPAWAPDADGEWGEVDTTFAQSPDGTITTTAAVSDITVSPGGTGPFVTATAPEGGSISLTWPETLPAPAIDGDTVTYADVFTDVDLQVTADVDGFAYALVVKTSAAAADPALSAIDIGITADGLTVTQDETGAITATDATGEALFSAPAAYMWDSSTNPDPEEAAAGTFDTAEEDPVSDLGEDDPMPGLYAEVGVDLDGGTLTVTPDADLLADPDVQFPITIDPPFGGKRAAWANIFKNRPGSSWTNDKDWPRKGGMRVGYNIWAGCAPDACGLWRSAVRFSGLGKLKNKDILTAQVSMTQTHSGGCGSTDLALYEANRKMTNGTTWNSITSATLDHLQTRSVASSNSTGCSTKYPNRDVNFTGSKVKSNLQDRVNAGSDWMTFMVRSSNESDPHAWRRIDTKSVELIVTYNSPAGNPTSLRTNGKACVTSGYTNAPWTSEVQPTLSGVPHDADGKVGARIQIRRKGSSDNVHTWSTSRNQTDGVRQSWTVPSGKKLSSGDYRWRMQSLDNYASGTDNWFDSWCYFRIDATSPTPPKVELVSPANPQAGDKVTFRLTATDAHSGMSGFSYGVNEEAQRTSVNSTGTTTITVTAPQDGGRIWLYVWAEDKAGNSSKRVQADFYAPRVVEPNPAAAWRLDGDGLDDTSAGHDLTMGRTSGWIDSGGDSPVGQAMVFGGGDCVSTEGPAIRTDVPYTVTAWARIDDADDNYRTVLSQSGANHYGFALRYRGISDEWDLVLNSEDERSPSAYARAGSTTAPIQGEWTHLAATVDPGSKIIQLWVNGTLQTTTSFAHEAWHADGPVNIGCGGRTDPTGNFQYFKGAVQHVGMWTGLLTHDQVQTVMAGDLPAGLAGEWLMDGDGTDSSLQTNHMTVPETGATWTEDQWGRLESAIDLDGTSCLTAGDSTQNRADASFSISTWAKVDAVDTGVEQVIAGEGGEQASKFKLMLSTGGNWSFSVTVPNAQGGVTWYSAVDVGGATADEWVHLLGVYDAAAREVRLYVNGDLAEAEPATGEPAAGYGKANIGCRGTASGGEGGGNFTGTISDVRLWRGAVTTEQATDVYGGNPAVERLAHWSLDDRNLNDAEGFHDLALHGDTGWGFDQFWLPDSALEFNGAGWAQTTGPVVRTDESFTVAAWVRLDSVEGPYQTILSQGGQHRVGFNLNYQASETGGNFQFAMPSADTNGTVTWHSVASEEPPKLGDWNHVAVVVDIPGGVMQMYVNGEMAAEAAVTETPWHADGPMYLGVYGRQNGSLIQHMDGALDRVQVWQSTLDPDAISIMTRAGNG